MSYLLTHPAAYEAMVESTVRQAEVFNLREFTTPANAARLLRVFNQLLEMPRPTADKTWKMSELVAAPVSDLQFAAEAIMAVPA